MRSLTGEVRSIQRKVLCMHKTWNELYRAKASAGCTFVVRWACVLFGTHAFLVVFVSSHPLMSGGPDSQAGLLPDMQRVNQRCAGHVLYRYVRRKKFQFLMRSAFVLPGSCPLLVRWCPLHCPVLVRLLCGHCAFYPLHTPFVRASSSNRDAFHHRIIFFRKVSIRRTSINAIRQGVTAA